MAIAEGLLRWGVTSLAISIELHGPSRYGRRVPTILRIGALRFFFFSNEGTEPPHIHVETGDGHAKFWLDPVTLDYSTGVKSADLKRARLLVVQHVTELKERWHEHFGT